jgi:hypothetical protein
MGVRACQIASSGHRAHTLTAQAPFTAQSSNERAAFAFAGD